MERPGAGSPKSSRDSLTAKSTTDPVLRNALRYTISAKEYQALHKYLISRSKLLKRNTPTVSQVEKLVERPGRDDYNAAAIRASLRTFLLTAVGLEAWDLIRSALFGVRRTPAHLSTSDATPFRKRNPRTSRTLTSRFAPAIGASLAGLMLGVYPKDQLRVTIAIYALIQAAEVTYNLAEEEGWIWGRKGSKWERPWFFGSWMLMPLTAGQLLHAFVFDRDCFPSAYGNFIIKHSPQYIQARPEEYPARLPWPGTYDIVDSLAEMARLNYPSVSPSTIL
ncbi:MAG: hypothetical protein M1818_000403 [Claussenomyces sp. TS43310]|nr:MAG: hypothetical protein M1818_000403 [Claussenomyces sp. TS43310]